MRAPAAMIEETTTQVPSGLGQPLLESGESSPWVEVSDDGSDDIRSQQTSQSADYEVIEESSERTPKTAESASEGTGVIWSPDHQPGSPLVNPGRCGWCGWPVTEGGTCSNLLCTAIL